MNLLLSIVSLEPSRSSRWFSIFHCSLLPQFLGFNGLIINVKRDSVKPMTEGDKSLSSVLFLHCKYTTFPSPYYDLNAFPFSLLQINSHNSITSTSFYQQKRLFIRFLTKENAFWKRTETFPCSTLSVCTNSLFGTTAQVSNLLLLHVCLLSIILFSNLYVVIIQGLFLNS